MTKKICEYATREYMVKATVYLSKLLNSDIIDFIDQLVDHNVLKRMTEIVAECFPFGKKRKSYIRESLRYLVGTILTKHEVETLCLRLSGRWSALRDEYIVWPTVVVEDDVCCGCIIDNLPRLSDDGRDDLIVPVGVIAGPLAPVRFSLLVYSDRIPGFLRVLGFSKPSGKYPLYTNDDLFQLWLGLYLKPDAVLRIRKKEVIASKYKVIESPSLIKRNREVLKARRISGEEAARRCRFGYTHPCYDCAAYFDICPLSMKLLNVMPIDA